MKESATRYPNSESSLYTISGMVYQNCINDLAKFTAHKKKYTLAFVDEILTLVSAAESIPNQEQRQSTQNGLRKVLTSAAVNCCDGFAGLMNYITTDGFTADMINVRKKEAGEDYYSAAGDDNWQAMRTMMAMALVFLKKYPAELANCDMPDDFALQMTQYAGAFSDALKNFNDYKTTIEVQTAAKITANNDLYDAVQSILADGKFIFRKDALTRKQYSYRALASKINTKKSGFHITLNNEVTTLPINLARISFVQSEKTSESNKIGVMEVELPEGKYNYSIAADDYATIEGVLEVDKNVMHRLRLTMKSVTGENTGMP